MRLVASLLALAVLVGWLGTVPGLLAQEAALVVEGRVVNATPGGGEVSGIPVLFHQESPRGHNDLEAPTDAEGRFRFEGVQYDPDVSYGVSVRYQGALYGIDLDLSAGSPPTVLLTVYDAVDDEAVVAGSSASVLFARVDKPTRTIVALEIVTIVNRSDRTYVPGPEPMKLLRFGLPPGAHSLQVDTALPGADFVQVDRGFALLGSVPPGEHEVMYTYEFPYSGAQVSFTKTFAYGVERLRVLAPDEVLRLSSGDLGTPEAITIGQRPYQLLQAVDLPRGARVSLELQGLPQPSLLERIGHRLKSVKAEYLAPVVLGLLMSALVGYALWRRGNERREGSTETLAVDEERLTIGQMIVDLERSFESGDLSEQEYRRRRMVLDKRLASLAGAKRPVGRAG